MQTTVQYLSDIEMKVVVGGINPMLGNRWRGGWHFWEPRVLYTPVSH